MNAHFKNSKYGGKSIDLMILLKNFTWLQYAVEAPWSFICHSLEFFHLFYIFLLEECPELKHNTDFSFKIAGSLGAYKSFLKVVPKVNL